VKSLLVIVGLGAVVLLAVSVSAFADPGGDPERNPPARVSLSCCVETHPHGRIRTNRGSGKQPKWGRPKATLRISPKPGHHTSGKHTQGKRMPRGKSGG
jgi:hypothetical protein